MPLYWKPLTVQFSTWSVTPASSSTSSREGPGAWYLMPSPTPDPLPVMVRPRSATTEPAGDAISTPSPLMAVTPA
jgi:hypothetical protein